MHLKHKLKGLHFFIFPLKSSRIAKHFFVKCTLVEVHMMLKECNQNVSPKTADVGAHRTLHDPLHDMIT